MGGCLVNWFDAFGLRAKIVDADEKPLSANEVEELRVITREIAGNERDLEETDAWKGEKPGDEIYDEYSTASYSGRAVTLYVAKDRRYAHIQVDDWNSAGRVNDWTLEVMNQVLNELAERLPDRAVEVETVNMGFWRP